MLKEEAPTLSAETDRVGQAWQRAKSLEWMGQMLASSLWISSVFVYGLESVGDWLQLAAACAWCVANLAHLAQGGASH